VTLEAHWALKGKQPGALGYEVLSASRGLYSKANFEEALDRFSTGTLEQLPEVTATFLPAAPGVGGRLAITFYRHAGGAEAIAEDISAIDRYGRDITWASYFCVPYAQAAGSALTYGALAAAVRGIVLPARGGRPVRVPATVPAPPAQAGDQARQAAALLLTGKPVCVLGAPAGGAGLAARLGFIDAVMSQLPYGMRATMAAATWASSSYRGHYHRLFFSDAPRHRRDDHILAWGNPGRALIPPGPARDYLTWLEGTTRPEATLAGMTAGTGFAAGDIRKVLAMTRQGARLSAPRRPERDQAALKPAPPPRGATYRLVKASFPDAPEPGDRRGPAAGHATNRGNGLPPPGQRVPRAAP
jgi:hypothetical protein